MQSVEGLFEPSWIVLLDRCIPIFEVHFEHIPAHLVAVPDDIGVLVDGCDELLAALVAEHGCDSADIESVDGLSEDGLTIVVIFDLYKYAAVVVVFEEKLLRVRSDDEVVVLVVEADVNLQALPDRDKSEAANLGFVLFYGRAPFEQMNDLLRSVHTLYPPLYKEQSICILNIIPNFGYFVNRAYVFGHKKQPLAELSFDNIF